VTSGDLGHASECHGIKGKKKKEPKQEAKLMSSSEVNYTEAEYLSVEHRAHANVGEVSKMIIIMDPNEGGSFDCLSSKRYFKPKDTKHKINGSFKEFIIIIPMTRIIKISNYLYSTGSELEDEINENIPLHVRI
jgi:hypothetical protein